METTIRRKDRRIILVRKTSFDETSEVKEEHGKRTVEEKRGLSRKSWTVSVRNDIENGKEERVVDSGSLDTMLIRAEVEKRREVRRAEKRKAREAAIAARLSSESPRSVENSPPRRPVWDRHVLSPVGVVDLADLSDVLSSEDEGDRFTIKRTVVSTPPRVEPKLNGQVPDEEKMQRKSSPEVRMRLSTSPHQDIQQNDVVELVSHDMLTLPDETAEETSNSIPLDRPVEKPPLSKSPIVKRKIIRKDKAKSDDRTQVQKSPVPDSEKPKSAEKPPPKEKSPQQSVKVVIRNLSRPFTISQLQKKLSSFGNFSDLWVDEMKTTCRVAFHSSAEASAVIKSLNDTEWPVGNPKRLSVQVENDADRKTIPQVDRPSPSEKPQKTDVHNSAVSSEKKVREENRSKQEPLKDCKAKKRIPEVEKRSDELEKRKATPDVRPKQKPKEVLPKESPKERPRAIKIKRSSQKEAQTVESLKRRRQPSPPPSPKTVEVFEDHSSGTVTAFYEYGPSKERLANPASQKSMKQKPPDAVPEEVEEVRQIRIQRRPPSPSPSRSPSPLPAKKRKREEKNSSVEKKKKVTDEDRDRVAQKRLKVMNTLFNKTKALPCLYWMANPAYQNQIAETRAQLNEVEKKLQKAARDREYKIAEKRLLAKKRKRLKERKSLPAAYKKQKRSEKDRKRKKKR